MFANLRAWGWITLIIGVLQLLATVGILTGNQLARWFAVAVLALNAIDMMFFVPAYPFCIARRLGGQLAGPFGIWRGTGSHLSRLSEPARTRTRPGQRLWVCLSARLYVPSQREFKQRDIGG